MLKSELRRLMRELKRQFTQQQLDELSFSVIQRLRPILAEVHTIYAYYSLPDEVNTHQLIDDLVAEGKDVFLPKVIDDETIAWYPYHGAQDLKEGAFHIMEPSDVTKESSTIYPCYILVPGMAFDAQGHRLGRGKGYYDRFLRTMENIPGVRTIGVCFDFQKVDEVPVDTYDMPVDEVV